MSRETVAGDRPHLVVVHGHDIGRWLSCHPVGATVPSPHVAALAERSVVFDQAFSVAPLCTPARSALWTGTSPHVNGLMGLAHNHWRYRPGVATAPELLTAAGYHSVLVGLQHEDPDPTTLGYETVVGQGFLPRAGQSAEDTERFLVRHAAGDDDRPLFLTVGIWEAHRPWPAEDYEPDDPAAVTVPAYLPDNADTRADLAAFHGALRQFDAAVGRVVAAVDRHLGADRTVLIVTTDHGAPLPRAKSTLYDSGLGVSLVVRTPGTHRTGGRRCGVPVSHLDVLPTLCEFAGAASRPQFEGRSLAPLLAGDAGEVVWPERPLYSEKTYHDRYDPKRAIRTDRHKLIINFAPGPRLALALDLELSPTRRGMGDAHLAPRPAVELYDLEADPDELVDLAEDPAHAGIRADLEQRLRAHLLAMHDPVLDGPIPTPAPLPHPRRAVGGH